MIYILYCLVVFVSTFLGAVAGLGGGVIIKPILDFVGYHSIATISFLSSISVFVMSLYSICKRIKYNNNINYSIALYISIGSMFGGVLGENLFQLLLSIFSNDFLKFIQSILLLCLLCFIYRNMKTQNITLHLRLNNYFLVFIGIVLGSFSSFLGIGGGPINVALFTFLFSFDIKIASFCSLITIFFSQLSKLSLVIVFDNIPAFDSFLLILLIISAIFGGIIGTKLSFKISDRKVKQIFNYSLLFIIGISFYNVFNSLCIILI